MEKKHLKRLGYGFSALVMAMSAVSFYPTANTYANTESGVVAGEATSGYVNYVASYIMKVGDVVSYADLIKAQSGYSIDSITVISGSGTNVADTGNSQVVNHSDNNQTMTANVSGHKKLSFHVKLHEENEVNNKATADVAVMFYVYNELNFADKVVYVKLGEESESTRLVTWHNRKVSNDSVLNFDGLKTEGSDNYLHVDTSTLGAKTVTVTETINGVPVTKPQVITFEVCGVDYDSRIDFFADTYYDLDLAGRIYGASIINYGVLTGRGTITMHMPATDLIQFDAQANHLNQYQAGIKVSYDGELGTEWLPLDVRVHDRLEILKEDTEINLAEGRNNNTASFTLNDYDGILSYTSNIRDIETGNEMFRVTYDGSSKTYTYTATEFAVPGKYTVTFTQTFEGTDLSHTETRVITVVDGAGNGGNTGNGEGDNAGNDEDNNGGDVTTPGTQTPDQGDLGLGGGSFGTGAGAGSVKTPDTGAIFENVAATPVAIDTTANAASASIAAATAAIAATTLAGAALIAKKRN